MSIPTTSSSSQLSRHVESPIGFVSPGGSNEVSYQEMPSSAMVPAISPEPRIFKPGPSDYFSATVTSAPLPSTADSLISTIIDPYESSLLSTTPLTSISSSSSYSSSAFTHSNLSSVSYSPPMSPSGQAPHTYLDGYPVLHNPVQDAPPRRTPNFPLSSGSRSAPDLTSNIFPTPPNRATLDFHHPTPRGLTYNPTLSHSSPSLMQTAPALSGPRSPYTPFRAFEPISVPPRSMHTTEMQPAPMLYHNQSSQPWSVSGHTPTNLSDPRMTPRDTSFRPADMYPRIRPTLPSLNPLGSQPVLGIPTGIPYGVQGTFMETPIARDAMLTYAYRLYSTSIQQADGLTSFPHQSEPEATAPPRPYQNQLLPLLTSMRSLHPRHLPTLLLLSCAHYAAGDLDECLEVSNEILSVNPNYVEAMSNIGMVMKAKGALTEAETWWRKAVRLRPTYWDAIDNLLKILCEPQKIADGVEVSARHQEALEVVDYVVNILLRHDGLLLVMVPPAHLHRLQNLLYTSGNLRSTIRLDISAGLHDYVRALELMFRPQGSIEAEDPLTLRDVVVATVVIGLLACQPQDSALLHAIADVLDINSSRFNRGMLDRRVDWLQLVHRNIQRVIDVLLREGNGAIPIVFLPPEKVERLADSLFSAFQGNLPALCTRSSYEEPWQLAPGINNSKQAGKVTAASLLALAKFLQYRRGKTVPTIFGHGKELPRGQSLILVLYYLAASFDPSPSTYNNMGILLYSIKRTSNVMNTHGQRETTNGVSLAKLYYIKGLSMDPHHVHLLTNYASLLKDQGRSLEAISMYQRALGINPNFDIALANVASALKDSGRMNEAIEYYQRALVVFSDFPDAVCGLANTLSSVCDWRGGRGSSGNEPIISETLEYLPRKDEADSIPYGWMGKLETVTRRQVQEMYSYAAGAVQAAGSMKDWLNVVKYAHGSNLTRPQFQRWEKLIHRFYTDFSRDDKAVNEIGFIIRLIEVMNRVLQRRWYNDANGGVQRHWSEKTSVTPSYRRARLPGSLEPPPVPSVLPFHTFAYAFDDRLLRIVAYRNALRVSYQALTASWLPQTVFEPPPPPLEKLNIGYVSSDFKFVISTPASTRAIDDIFGRNHPLAHLMVSVFRMHDREKFNVHIYATTGSDNSNYRQNIEQNADVFRDFSSSSVQAMVEQVVADKIHILINLGGYTKGARNELFAARPSPIQVSLMGYAGTSGASWCDYLIADAHAAPATAFAPYRQAIRQKEGKETSRMQDGFTETDLESDITEENADPESLSLDWAFTEKFVHMPHSYFATDHRQAFREDDYFDPSLSQDEIWSLEERLRHKMRKEIFPDLPENVIIFACFSQLYKICPRVFWVWMRILRRVPGSILWLLRFPSAGEDNLLRAAATWGGPEVASRVRFTDIAKKDVHVRRCRVADLFLDTFQCNAHTIATDVLWTGTPILTWPKERHKMCTRVASSIAYATGFGEHMVVSGETAYENRAVALAKSVSYAQESDGEGDYYRKGSGELIDLRRQLFVHRDKMPLFDTARWTKNVERAYREIWKHWVESCKPPWTDVEENGGCIVITDDQPFFST